jgi:hypothetical protein
LIILIAPPPPCPPSVFRSFRSTKSFFSSFFLDLPLPFLFHFKGKVIRDGERKVALAAGGGNDRQTQASQQTQQKQTQNKKKQKKIKQRRRGRMRVQGSEPDTKEAK